MRRFTELSAVAAAAAMTVLGGGGAAGAATGSVAQSHSSIFAGYSVSKPTAHVKRVTATFVVPSITCHNSFSGVGPSVLVYSNVNQKTSAHITSGAGLGAFGEGSEEELALPSTRTNGHPLRRVAVDPNRDRLEHFRTAPEAAFHRKCLASVRKRR